ncbi:MAG: hypothetical protein MUO63_03135 [Desulfobulbaceae bacterium]|nr:hypothetical protein [Desulfobulbaceae bacterium]
MNKKEKIALEKIAASLEISRTCNGETPDIKNNRKYYGALRDAFHLFEDVVCRLNQAGKELQGSDGEFLKTIASEAIMNLGGVSDPSPISLKEYNHQLYGPYLGISDAGGAAHIIRRAAFSSPKHKVLGSPSPMEIGVAHDAERLAAVGEVAVGPEEYRDIILECHGSIMMSTNIGTRLNLRYYKIRPTIYIPNGSLSRVIDQSIEKAKTLLEPFWHTPDGIPRPVTFFASFRPGKPFTHRLAILEALDKALSQGEFCDRRCHKLGLLVAVRLGRHGLEKAMDAIDLAHQAGITEVAIQGPVRWEAQDKISMPGLLNYFSPTLTGRLLAYAGKNNVKISPKNLVDPDTVARNVWTGLQVARNMGLHLGKYGLSPLTLDEADEVMGKIQGFFNNWTTAPVFYIDFPHISGNKVYSGKFIQNGAEAFLDIVERNQIPVVLFDTADKGKGRKLIKQPLKDRIGILTLKQIKEIDSYSRERGIKSLWAGGISIPQAFELGKLKVFGIYVTTAAATVRPVTDKYKRDPMVTAEREITFDGVSRTKLLIEAGFLVTSLRETDFETDADTLEDSAKVFIRLLDRPKDYESQDKAQGELFDLTTTAWKRHFEQVL